MRKYLLRVPTAEAVPIQGDDLEKAATDATESAAGGDQWGPRDLKKLSKKAYARLAEIMTCVKKKKGQAGRLK